MDPPAYIFPVITMRLFAEEKRSGAIELLLTAPVSDAQASALREQAALMQEEPLVWDPSY